MDNLLNRFAEENNLIIGVCNEENLSEIEGIISLAQTPFVVSNMVARTAPKTLYPWVRSIIVIGMPYGVNIPESDQKLRGYISVSGAGQDYHLKLKEKLQELTGILTKANKNPFQYEICVDTGKLVERELARKAGLGSYGRNNNIIAEKFGSYFHIGYLVTDLSLTISKSSPFENAKCTGCNICIKKCPIGVLKEKKEEINFQNCISYLTQKKGCLTPKEMVAMGNSIYGCDICQKFCPCNKDKLFGKIEIEDNMPTIDSILKLTNRGFREKWGKTASSWRGRKLFVRNAIIALGNSEKEEARPILVEYLEDKDQDIRQTALQALKILENGINGNK